MVGQPKLTSVPALTPILESGDHLTRTEFERRYSAMPHVKKAELLEGIVHMPSPVRHSRHGGPFISLAGWLWSYQSQTPGVSAGGNSTVRLDMDNEPQPDALMFVLPEYGGRVVLSEDDYIEGAPEFVAEIAASTVSIDLHAKLNVYRRNQVQEYLVWRVEDSAVDWFVLREGVYEKLSLLDGIYRSEVFPGLWLDAEALVREESQRVFRVLQEGLARSEHAAFVDRLALAGREFQQREGTPPVQ
jgi:Uma2 family endonuclease